MSENQPINPAPATAPLSPAAVSPLPAPQPTVQPMVQSSPSEGGEEVPRWRFKQESERRAHYKSLAETQAREIAELKAKAAEIEATLTGHKTTTAHRLAMARMAAERPALAHDSIQEFLLNGYTSAIAGQEEPPGFADWLATVEEANDPLYAPHLARKAGPDPRVSQVSTLLAAVDAGTMTPEQAAEAFMAALSGGTQEQPAALTPAQQFAALLQQMVGQNGGSNGQPAQVLQGDPNGGTRPVTTAAKTYTTAEIQRIKAQHGGRLPAHVRAALLQNLKQSGSVA